MATKLYIHNIYIDCVLTSRGMENALVAMDSSALIYIQSPHNSGQKLSLCNLCCMRVLGQSVLTKMKPRCSSDHDSSAPSSSSRSGSSSSSTLCCLTKKRAVTCVDKWILEHDKIFKTSTWLK